MSGGLRKPLAWCRWSIVATEFRAEHFLETFFGNCLAITVFCIAFHNAILTKFVHWVYWRVTDSTTFLKLRSINYLSDDQLTMYK